MGPMDIGSQIQAERRRVNDQLQEDLRARENKYDESAYGECYEKAYHDLDLLALWVAYRVSALDPSFALVSVDA